jgi:hypothetical protein
LSSAVLVLALSVGACSSPTGGGGGGYTPSPENPGNPGTPTPIPDPIPDPTPDPIPTPNPNPEPGLPPPGTNPPDADNPGDNPITNPPVVDPEIPGGETPTPPSGSYSFNAYFGNTSNTAEVRVTADTIKVYVQYNVEGGTNFNSTSSPDKITDYVQAMVGGGGVNLEIYFAKDGANDKISFGEIARLKQYFTTNHDSLTFNAGGPDKVTFAPPVLTNVYPVFNGDDMYGNPDSAPSNIGKVFTVYNDGDVIVPGFTMRTTGGNSNYIEVNNKDMYVEKLRHYKDNTKTYTDNFGIKVIGATPASKLHFVANPIMSFDDGVGGATRITPIDLSTALDSVGLKYDNGLNGTVAGSKLFTIPKIKLASSYTGSYSAEANIADKPNALRFLERHANDSRLGSLEIEGADNKLLIRGANNPYSGSDVSVDALQVSGNLAVLLMTKGKSMQELVLLNPSLTISEIASTPPITNTPMRNLVLAGNNWKFVPMGNASGVITSLNNPVKSISNGNNTNLWYSVLGFDGVDEGVQVTMANILELSAAVGANSNKFYNSTTGNLRAGNSAVLTNLVSDIFFRYNVLWLKDKLVTSAHTGALPPHSGNPTNSHKTTAPAAVYDYTKQQWAANVISGSPLTPVNESAVPAAKKYGTSENLSSVSLTPSAGSIRLADGKANDADQLRQLASVPTHELGDRRLLEGFFGRVDKASKDGSMTAADKNPPYGGGACQPAYG